MVLFKSREGDGTVHPHYDDDDSDKNYDDWDDWDEDGYDNGVCLSP